MLRSAASPGSVGFGRSGGGSSGLLMTPPPAGHLFLSRRPPDPCLRSTDRACRLCASRSPAGQGGTSAKCKGRLQRRPFLSKPSGRPRLLDLRFAELDVLLGDRVVFLLHELVGHGARVLARHVIEAGVGAGHELDLDGGGLRHGGPLSIGLGRNLEHDPEKWKPVFGKDHAQTTS